MPLTRLLLCDPTTPTAAVTACADRFGHDLVGAGELAGLIVAHPNLPDAHPVLSSQQALTARTLLDAMRTGWVPAARRRALLSTASTRAGVDYLLAFPQAMAGDVAVVARTGVARRGGVMGARLAWPVAKHPGTAAQLRADALNVLLRPRRLRVRRREQILFVTVAHPEVWPLLGRAGDPEMTAVLDRYAVEGGYAHLVADTCAGAATAPEWVALLARFPELGVFRAALAALGAPPDGVDRRTRAELVATLMSAGAVRDVDTDAAVLEADLFPTTALGRFAPSAVSARTSSMSMDAVRLMARDLPGSHSWLLDLPASRRDLDEVTVEALWDASERVRTTHVAGPLAAVRCASLALNPAASERVRAGAVARLVEFGCSGQADRSKWLRISVLVAAIETARRAGFAAAGRDVPVDVLSARRAPSGQALALGVPVAAALAGASDVLARPGAGQLLLELGPTFAGTVGELLDAVAGATC